LIGLTGVIRKIDHNASTMPYNSYKLNAQSTKILVKIQNKRQGALVKYTRACIDPKLG
jgi:hypothetical protein